jgi:hypothetical protein
MPNDIPLGCSLLLPVDTVNCVQTLKVALVAAVTTDPINHELCHLLMTSHNTEGVSACSDQWEQTANHELCHSLMTSHNNKGLVWQAGCGRPPIGDPHYAPPPMNTSVGSKESGVTKCGNPVPEPTGPLHGARFSAEIYTPGCHRFPRLLTSSELAGV